MVDESLGSLKSRLQKEIEQLEQKRSSREAYLAVWKASPYFLISVTGLTLTSLAYSPTFFGIGIMAGLVIFGMTIFCWLMTMKRDTEISSYGRGIDELEKAVNDRVEFARAAFLSYLPRLMRLPSEPGHIRFSNKPDPAERFSFDDGLVQRRVEDMTNLNPGLIKEMQICDALFNEFEISRALLSKKLSDFLESPQVIVARKNYHSLPEIKTKRQQNMINVFGTQNEMLKQCIFREIAAVLNPLAFAFDFDSYESPKNDLVSFMTETESQDNPFQGSHLAQEFCHWSMML